MLSFKHVQLPYNIVCVCVCVCGSLKETVSVASPVIEVACVSYSPSWWPAEMMCGLLSGASQSGDHEACVTVMEIH